MWPLRSGKHKYEAVASEDIEVKDFEASEGSTEDGTDKQQLNRRERRDRYLCGGLSLALLIGLFVLVVTFFPKLAPYLAKSEQNESNAPTQALRREWRTLSRGEQESYISAVLCLRQQPSIITPNGNMTAYDDYPWIHSRIGYFTHHTAAFLPWHRYFLHIYETTLREKCGYQGSLVYWDWTLDWEALEKSPVFDAKTGFGGDGEVGGELTVSKTGRCVIDGPFAGVVADYYDVRYQPHCLSRGFRDLEGKLGHIDGHEIRPESIEEVLSVGDYETFVAQMESRVHDVIPYGISGDFETFTAPYDPLFFLHHTQLDRLWWLWQLRQPGGGLEAYRGHKGRHSIEMVNLDDEIDVGALAPKVKVREVMDVHGELLRCDY